MPVLHLLDNDIVLKASRYDLIEELKNHIGGIESIRILDTLRYRFYLNDKMKALTYCKTDEAFNRLIEFVAQSPILELPENSDDISRLNEVTNIDQGEVLLFAYNIWAPGSVTFTGDKRAILALSNIADINDLVDVIRGRVKCLEQIAAEFIYKYGFEIIQNKINSDQDCDKSLKNCFRCPTEGDVMYGLKSYYEDLNSATNGLLAPFPSS